MELGRFVQLFSSYQNFAELNIIVLNDNTTDDTNKLGAIGDIEYAIEEFDPSIIILDAGNNDTLQGLDVCRKLKFETQNLKSNIIFTTTIHDKELVLNAGADLYLPKPYELSVMFGWIKKFNDNYNE